MLPPAIIFVNNDLTEQVLGILKSQLFITELIDGYEFDLRVLSDPNYPDIIHLNNIRLLVIRSFNELNNRNLADVAIFVKAGLLSIEYNKFGPHGQTFPVDRINIYKLLKDYPASNQTFSSRNNVVQDNILYPRYDKLNSPDAYPFGQRFSIIPGGRGLLIDIPRDTDFTIKVDDEWVLW